ncbi:MAG TPA: hypothetical protein VF067_06865 [Sphingomicrobium sp.]
MRLAMGIGAIALALSSCDWMERTDPAPRTDASKERLEQVRKACASRLTYARLKEYVFDQAARVGTSDPRGLDSLAAYSVVRMDDPVVKSRDDDLNIIVCTGRFVLDLPPGIRDAFNGQSAIAADVEYAAQAAADGSGLVYSMTGAEPIIYRIATLGLAARPMPHIAAAPMAPPREETADITPVEVVPERPAPTASVGQKPDRTIARSVQQRSPATKVAPVAKTAASPSFNCRRARTASEKMVCGNGALAAADRRMSAVFYGEMASADAETKSVLRRTRDSFLGRRERCSTQSCVAQVYEERIAEIRRISRR